MEAGKTFEEIDQQLNVQSRVLYRRALRKISRDDLLKRYPMIAMQMEQTNIAALDQETIEAARTIGLSDTVLKAVNRRLAARRGQAKTPTRRLSDRDAIAALEERLHLALEYMDDFVLAGSSAKDLGGVIDTLIENIQLLKGRPTSIMSIEDRRKLNELIPAIINEAKRRGVALPVEVVDAEVVGPA